MVNSDDNKVDPANVGMQKPVRVSRAAMLKAAAEEIAEEDEKAAEAAAEEKEKAEAEDAKNKNKKAEADKKEEQENKAIISYEQLLKNASNISLSYKDEKNVKGAPKIQKIEVNQKEVSTPEIYLEEEEFLKILKEFRISLQ